MSDYISREQAVRSARFIYDSDSQLKALTMMRMLRELPSVTPTDISVIEDIKTEIMALEPQYPIDDNTPYISSQSVWKIVNKHCGGENGMSDLIDRQAVYDAITEIDCGINMDIYTDEVRKIIDDIPTVGMVKVHSKVRDKE